MCTRGLDSAWKHTDTTLVSLHAICAHCLWCVVTFITANLMPNFTFPESYCFTTLYTSMGDVAAWEHNVKKVHNTLTDEKKTCC